MKIIIVIKQKIQSNSPGDIYFQNTSVAMFWGLQRK